MNVIRITISLVLVVVVSACSMGPVKPAPVEDRAVKQPAVNVKKQVVKKPVVKPVSKKVSLAIVFDERNQASREIAEQLADVDKFITELYPLSETNNSTNQIGTLLQNTQHQHIVAIGPKAAAVASTLEGKDVVYSQVFNIDKSEFKSKSVRGVSMIPAPDKLFGLWKQLSPNLSKVGIFTGPGHEESIASIKAASAEQGVQVEHFEVANDKELLFAVKREAPKMQGFWLLPDNRVLSRRAMKDFMGYSLKQGKQVAVFNKQLLKFGGLIYVSNDPSDVASNILQQVNSNSGERPKELLDDAVLSVSARTAKQLNLDVTLIPKENVDG